MTRANEKIKASICSYQYLNANLFISCSILFYDIFVSALVGSLLAAQPYGE